MAKKPSLIQYLTRRFLVRNAGPAYGGWGGGLTHGEIVNPISGMGLSGDKSEVSFFTPTRLHSRHELEVIYVQSWAARKFIDIPIDDLFINPRLFVSEGGDRAAEAMREAEDRHEALPRLARAMKAGRLYGTGLLVMVTREANLSEPLMLERVRPGDLLNLLPLDRYDASVFERDDDPYSPTYGQALRYFLTPSRGVGFHVHASRVLRFDGLSPLSADSYTIYDRVVHALGDFR